MFELFSLATYFFPKKNNVFGAHLKSSFFSPNSRLRKSLKNIDDDDQALEYLHQNDIFPFNHNEWTLMVCDLPFYKNYKLYSLRDTDEAYAFLYAQPNQVKKGTHFIPLDGRSGPIYEANQADTFILNQDTVKQYLYFFGEFVYGETKGKKSPFLHFEHFSEIPWYSSLDEETKVEVIGALRTQFPVSDDGEIQTTLEVQKKLGFIETYHFSVPIVYQNSLFSAHMHVMRSGYVRMIDDRALHEFIGERPVAPINVGLDRPERSQSGFSLVLLALTIIAFFGSIILSNLAVYSYALFGIIRDVFFSATIPDINTTLGKYSLWFLLSGYSVFIGIFFVSLSFLMRIFKDILPFSLQLAVYNLEDTRLKISKRYYTLKSRFLYVLRSFSFAALAAILPFTLFFYSYHAFSGDFFNLKQSVSFTQSFFFVIDNITRIIFLDIPEVYSWNISSLRVDTSKFENPTIQIAFRFFLSFGAVAAIVDFWKQSGISDIKFVK